MQRGPFIGGVWLAGWFVSRSPKGVAAVPTSANIPSDLFSLLTGSSAPLTLYLKCCYWRRIYALCCSELWLNQLLYSRLALFPLEKLNFLLVPPVQYNPKRCRKKKLVSSPVHWWWKTAEMCSVAGYFSLLERQAQKASQCSCTSHDVKRAMYMK